MPSPRLQIELPPWVDGFVDWQRHYPRLEDRMALVVELGHEQVRRATGGPFAAAVFERDSGVLVAVGVNLAVPAHNCVLHAEAVALMMAAPNRANSSATRLLPLAIPPTIPITNIGC